MNSKENLYRKQEKLFKILFVTMCLTLGVLYYQTFYNTGAAVSEKKEDCSSTSTACVLGPRQGRTVDNLIPALCCQNRR